MHPNPSFRHDDRDLFEALIAEMWARRNDGRQGVEHALFARLGGHWHLLDTAGKASALQTALVPGAPLTVRYAVLGDHRVRLRHSAALA